VLTAQAFGDIVPLKDNLLAVVGHGQVLADVTLFAVTQNVVRPVGHDVEWTVEVFRSDRTNCKPFVIALKESRQEGVGSGLQMSAST
jgi:hypothetical protein